MKCGRGTLLFLLIAVACSKPELAYGQGVVINEIVDDNRAADSTGGDPDTAEFIELFNSSNTPINIAGWTLSYWQLGTTAGGGSYFATTDEIPAGTILQPNDYYVLGHDGVPNVDQPLGSSIDLFPNGNVVYELRNGPQATGTLMDAVALETFRNVELTNLRPEHPAQVGGGYWGQTLTMFADSPNLPSSIGRYLDGRDTNINGRDFGFLPITPGTANNLPQNPSHTIVDVDAMANGTALSSKYYASFLMPRVIDPTSPASPNPSAIPESPQGDKAIIAWDETGGGNVAFSKELVNKFALHAYIETADLNQNQAAVQSEASTYGIGTSDPFFSTPNQAALNTLTSTANGNTGIGWMIQRAEQAGGGPTTTLLQLIDFNDGGDSVVADADWQIIRTFDLSSQAAGWHELSIDYNPTTGAVVAKFDDETVNFNTVTNLLGTFYVGYRENLPGTGGTAARPPTYDLFVPSEDVPGDYNGDGNVTSADYTSWKNSFGTSVTPGTGADGSNNGVIDAADYTVWRDNFTGSGAAALAVPEPTALLLAACGLAFLPSRRRR